MSSARARTQSTRSRVERTNHEATAHPIVLIKANLIWFGVYVYQNQKVYKTVAFSRLLILSLFQPLKKTYFKIEFLFSFKVKRLAPNNISLNCVHLNEHAVRFYPQPETFEPQPPENISTEEVFI